MVCDQDWHAYSKSIIKNFATLVNVLKLGIKINPETVEKFHEIFRLLDSVMYEVLYSSCY